MFELKTYQKKSLEMLEKYLEAARVQGAKAAFEDLTEHKQRYKTVDSLEDVPYVCLRLPTGGGKTILAAHSIKVATGTYLEQDFPVVLWLVPTNTIRQQTRDALKDSGHYYRQALDDTFDGRVAVYDIGEVEQIRPQDLAEKVCIVVGTLATLRVDKTEGRRVYAHNENFEPHFSRVPNNTAGLERMENGFDQGQIKYSFANLLHLHNPLIVMDEAHNARTPLTFEALGRLRPACVIEFTATPLRDIRGSNILYQVSASELKAEDMIKLPIMLTEHKNWEQALSNTILTRQKLEEIARKDPDFIRPIALIQAENKDREITVEVIRKHLVENEKIDPERIAIATGSQRDLDNVDLFDPKCKIEYIITVEALKEGWDCSFAYVFCSVANIHSSRDVEQILGRVLRMPYARRRKAEELNKAYAHLASPAFATAASALHDRLVDMGFEEEEANVFVEHEELPITSEDLPLFSKEAKEPLSFELTEAPAGQIVLDSARAEIITDNSGKTRIIIAGEITDQDEETLVNALSKSDRDAARRKIRVYRLQEGRKLWPAERGETFVVPRLCVLIQGELELAERELFLNGKGWNLLDYPAEFNREDLNLDENARTFEIDINGKKVVYRLVDNTQQLDLSHLKVPFTDLQLVRWLDRETRQPDIKQEIMLEFLRQSISHLTRNRGIELANLWRNRFVLARFFRERIARYRQDAYEKGYQDMLFGPQSLVETTYTYSFTFDGMNYPANWFYKGSYIFKKHFYPTIGELDSSGEEFECARALDSLPSVKHWVRNVLNPHYSYWFPTSTDRFYPDFMAELQDGRVFAVEYKGKVYVTNDDSQEKRNLGERWEENSKGKALFLMAEKRDSKGRDVYKQLADKVVEKKYQV